MTDFDLVKTASNEYSTSWKFGNRSFRYKVVLLQVVSIRTQAVKLHKNFDHFKKSSQLKNILGEHSSFFKPSTWNYLHLENFERINLYRNTQAFVSKRPVTENSNVQVLCSQGTT